MSGFQKTLKVTPKTKLELTRVSLFRPYTFYMSTDGELTNHCSKFSEHLSRLHMILKPFMLRRIKKDVENELSDKIEIMVYCPLTTRQKLLYKGI